MDFLNAVKKQLESIEEQQRLLQAMESSGLSRGPDGKLLFQPRDQGQGGQKARGQQGRNEKKGKKQRQQQRQQPAPQQRSLVSHDEVFETPHCATEGQASAVAPPVSATLRDRLMGTLHGRMDEAFLLSEVLGPPRCVRGWADD